MYPDTTVRDVAIPSGMCPKRFSPDGRYLLCFLESQRGIALFEFRWPSRPYVTWSHPSVLRASWVLASARTLTARILLDRRYSGEGDTAAHSDPKKLRETCFADFLRHRFELNRMPLSGHLSMSLCAASAECMQLHHS